MLANDLRIVLKSEIKIMLDMT